MNRRLIYEYNNNWKFDVNSCLGDFTRVRKFLPIPNVNLCFEFKAWYEVISPRDIKSSLSVFRLKLGKLYGFNLKPFLEFDIEVSVNYNSRNNDLLYTVPCLKKYQRMSRINVENMDNIWFENSIDEMYDGSYESTHHKNIKTNQLVLVCKMKFYCDLSLSEICRQEVSNPNTFIEDLQYFFESKELSDIVFNIGKKSIPAHKVILAAHSPVFKAMLTQDFLESKANCIVITDCAYDLFEHFLRFMYYRKIEDTSFATVTQLNVLSDKYDVSSLKDECARIFMSYMCLDNICDILKNAYDFNNDKLKIPATVFATIYFDKLESREDWKTLAEGNPLIGYEVLKKVNET